MNAHPRTLLLTQSDIAALLPMGDCIEAMEEALLAVGRGEAVLPLRMVLPVPRGGGVLALMPACLANPPIVGAKVITVIPSNHGTGLDSHQGAVLLFEAERGRLLAVLDATAITTTRTAAVSGVATARLARADAGDLAILGSGVQARAHLDAMRAVRALRRVRVWSRSEANARAFAERESARTGLRVLPAPSARDAVEGADLIVTATSAPEPVLRGAWVSPGAHINAIGACLPTERELDSEAVARARVYVDRMESARAEAGDFLFPIREGVIDASHLLGEIGDVLLGRLAGRGAPGEITLFKGLGLAVEDLAAAHRAYRNAVASGRGTSLELGGVRSSP